jgi:hypothetical protein
VQDSYFAGDPIANIVDCRRHITDRAIRPWGRVEIGAPEMTKTYAGGKSRIRSNEPSELSTQELARFEDLIRAGAPT